jgi:flagellar motor switch protein FliG
MVQKTKKKSSGIHKAAVLMVALGTEESANIYQNLDDSEIEKITKEVVTLQNVDSETVFSILEEFYQMSRAQEIIAAGGVNYAQEVLEKALGGDRAMEIIKRTEQALKVKGFNVLRKADPQELLSFVQKEHPQTIAFVLTQLSPAQASSILAMLPPDLQSEVVYRFANMERVSPETIRTVETVLESRVDLSLGTAKLGGVKAIAEVLNLIGQSAERSILNRINEQDPEMATEIKNLMFVFEDVVHLDDQSVQRVLKEVDNRELAMALKHVSDDVKKKILSNLSERASQIIEEEIEYMGAVRLKEVEDAQQRIVDIIRKLEEDGLVVIVGGARAEEMVE